jgi:hypothetical protein
MRESKKQWTEVLGKPLQKIIFLNENDIDVTMLQYFIQITR